MKIPEAEIEKAKSLFPGHKWLDNEPVFKSEEEVEKLLSCIDDCYEQEVE